MIWLAAAMAQDAPPVVGGSDAPAGRWPATAAIVRNGFTDCTGVLVAEDVLLTAGHCIGEGERAVHFGVDHQDADVVVGIADQLEYPDSGATLDVGLIWLDEPVAASLPPVMLGCAVGYLTDGAEAQLVGFGNTETDGGGPTSRQQEVGVEVTDADCSSVGDGCRVPGSELIAGGDGADSCSGDSGGPLYVWGDDVPYVAGVTSRAALSGTRTCGDGGVYVRFDAIAAWIEAEADVALQVPDCGGWENSAPVPSAAAISLRQGEVAEVQLDATDADTGQVLSWSVGPSELGRASVDGDVLRYEAGDAGVEQLAVEVTDGVATTGIDVPVEVAAYQDIQVIEPEPRFGCAHAPGAWLLGLLLLSPRWLRSRRPGR